MACSKKFATSNKLQLLENHPNNFDPNRPRFSIHTVEVHGLLIAYLLMVNILRHYIHPQKHKAHFCQISFYKDCLKDDLSRHTNKRTLCVFRFVILQMRMCSLYWGYRHAFFRKLSQDPFVMSETNTVSGQSAVIWRDKYPFLMCWLIYTMDINWCKMILVSFNIQSTLVISKRTLWNTWRYPYLDISDLQNWGKNNSNNHIYQIYTVYCRYLEFQGTLWNTSRYTYFDISGLQN